MYDIVGGFGIEVVFLFDDKKTKKNRCIICKKKVGLIGKFFFLVDFLVLKGLI